MTSLIISTKDHLTEAAQVKSLTNINPEVSAANLQTFAQMTAALSADSFIKAVRIDETALDGSAKIARPVTAFQYVTASGFVAVPSDGIINMTTSQVAGKSLRLRIRTPYDVAPIISDYSDNATDTKTALGTVSWADVKGLTDRQYLWQVQFQCDVNATIAITPRVVSFKVSFLATPQYDSWSRNITFNVTEG